MRNKHVKALHRPTLAKKAKKENKDIMAEKQNNFFFNFRDFLPLLAPSPPQATRSDCKCLLFLVESN
jgi:hypothetical protein